MRILTGSTVLGTSLVALAILNFSVLDQIGVGLVDSVEKKFGDLGAEWIGLRIANATLDPQGLADALASIHGVQHSFAFWTTLQAAPSAAGTPTVREWVMTSDDYDLDELPYIFVFQQDSQTEVKFYRDTITWVAGAAPAAGQVGISSDYADETGYGVGDAVQQRFGAFGGPFASQQGYNASYTVGGVYQRAYADPLSNPNDVIFVGQDPLLKNALRGGFRTQARGNFTLMLAPPATNITVVQAELGTILDVSDRIADHVEAKGLRVSTEQFQAGGRAVGGRMVAAPIGAARGGAPPGGGFQPPAQPDVFMLANGAVLAAALDAAESAGTWFRFLTTSAVTMAVLGIAFVTAALEKKVRRDVGIRQAVGFPPRRIYRHWALVALAMGLLGAFAGVGLVYAISAMGLSEELLGMSVAFRSSLGIVVAPIASVLIYAFATLPTYRKVLRASPTENLRALSE